VWPDVPTACESTIKITGSVEPNESDLTVYRDGYQVYRELYPSLEKIFHKMKD
jgi:sugar (pentulose or hexulose) kinase